MEPITIKSLLIILFSIGSAIVLVPYVIVRVAMWLENDIVFLDKDSDITVKSIIDYELNKETNNYL